MLADPELSGGASELLVVFSPNEGVKLGEAGTEMRLWRRFGSLIRHLLSRRVAVFCCFEPGNGTGVF